MNIYFDNITRDALKNNLDKKNKDAVRLLVKGFGWAGPTFGVALDEQHKNDMVTTIDGITFVAENDIAFMFEDVNLIHKNGLFGDSFDILSKNGLTNKCNGQRTFK